MAGELCVQTTPPNTTDIGRRPVPVHASPRFDGHNSAVHAPQVDASAHAATVFLASNSFNLFERIFHATAPGNHLRQLSTAGLVLILLPLNNYSELSFHVAA
jgi:hypothetical protein